MGYVIGIDGGGTKTRLKIANINKELLADCQGGPSNIHSNSIQVVKENLRQVIDAGLRQAQIELDDLDCICIGAAGAAREKDKLVIQDIFNQLGVNCRLIITHDAITALYGALGKGKGIILISGTGSICYGRSSDGEFHRTGGWGHIIGDEGSGYDIGRRILIEVMKGYDGRQDKTVLTELVMDKLGLNSPEDLIHFVYSNDTGKREIAAVGGLLDEACSAGDLAALRIVQAAANELQNCIEAVVRKLRLENTPVDLVLQGSVLEKGQHVKEKLSDLIAHNYPLISIRTPMEDAAWGAVLMAIE